MYSYIAHFYITFFYKVNTPNITLISIQYYWRRPPKKCINKYQVGNLRHFTTLRWSKAMQIHFSLQLMTRFTSCIEACNSNLLYNCFLLTVPVSDTIAWNMPRALTFLLNKVQEPNVNVNSGESWMKTEQRYCKFRIEKRIICLPAEFCLTSNLG